MSRQFVLIGHPVSHSISPEIHGHAYRLLGVDAEYHLRDCPDESAVRAVVDEIRKGELHGANVTVPWKHLAFELADRHDDTALGVGVANVLCPSSDGELVAYNTDAAALGHQLRSAVDAAGVDFEARPAAFVIGNGGGALAAVVGCGLSGIDEIYVSARRFDPRCSVSEWPRAEQFEKLGAKLVAWPTFAPGAWNDCMKRARLIVQATSAGMKGATGGKSSGEEIAALVPFSQLESAVAYDLVYNPPITPFLAQAQAHGLSAVGGLGMLVGQAKVAIEIWLGESPDERLLAETARKALGL